MSPKASPAEITAAYRVLVQIFHPDRFADSPPSVREEAEVRMKSLTEAYNLARKGFLAVRPTTKENGSRKKPGTKPAPGSPGQKAWTGVPWDVAVRERAAQAAKAEEARREREREARNGNAVPRPRPKKSPSVLNGMGLARYTGNIPCKGCKSIQWLPEGWKDRLEDTVYLCSICGRLLLSR